MRLIISLLSVFAMLSASAASAQQAPAPTSSSSSSSAPASPPPSGAAPPPQVSMAPTPPAGVQSQSSSTFTAIPPPATAAGGVITPLPLPTITTADGTIVPVFGVDLFSGTYAGTRPSDRPDYVIQPGDQISINIYGAIANSAIMPVDASGNVFVPGVGPVKVAGIQTSQLQATVAAKVHSIFTAAIGVYATVVQAGTIGVFVSGDVVHPGRYPGGAHDSVLFYLSQAGGIDAARGSFRDIVVQRNGRVVATYDLYDFILRGQTEPMRFQDGDTIFVAPRGAMVGVTGIARNAYAFEAPRGAGQMTGQDLLPLARPEPTVTSAGVTGFRNGAPQSAYYPLNDFARVILQDGDHITLRSDSYAETVTVVVQGEIHGPTVFVVQKGTMLSQLLAKIPLEDTNVDPRFVHIQRAAVAQEQKRAINDALFHLQEQVLTVQPFSSAQASLASAQASLVLQFVARAQTVQPDGNVAVYTADNKFHDMRLENMDTVILPNKSDVVIVTGQVMDPGGVTFARGESIGRYVARSGGFAPNANKSRFVLRHLDGSAEPVGIGAKPRAGDTVVIMPKVGTPYFQMVADVMALIFQTAISAATVAKL